MRRVLIADDDDLMRAGLVELLTVDPEIEIVGQASTGREAVEQARRLAPDVVLMDVWMPDLDGIEATRQIRAREAERSLSRTRVLALTANTLVEDRYACFEAGMDGFLVKPLDRDKLAEALEGFKPARATA